MTEADFRTLGYPGYIFYPKRGSCLSFYNCVLNVTDIAEEAERADIHLLQPHFNEAASRIDIVIRKLLFQLADAQAVGDELAGVDLHLILADRASKVGNIHDVRNRLEFFKECPVFDGPQLHQVVSRIGAPECVPVDLPHRTPVSTDLRSEAL